jgi:hypothetical protein
LIAENARRRAHEGGNGKDLPVIEPAVAEHLDVGGRRRVRILGDLPGSRGYGLLLIGQPGVTAGQDFCRQSGVRRFSQFPAPRQRAVGITEGRSGRGHQMARWRNVRPLGLNARDISPNKPCRVSGWYAHSRDTFHT